MSGRRRATFAVDREPVLAWNVPSTFHGGAPYPDMPAAAAVSPVVPPGADPYGRCWQNHVEAGCLPYIGTLYSSSLPPSYRVQPCVSSLGQIWPPTPPPDGCSRHDAANNSFYFCPPMSPMFVHGDSISQSIGSALPRVSHYSQLSEPNIESTVHSSGYQIESQKSSASHLATVCRTVPKCKSSNSAHPYDTTRKKPDVMLISQGVQNAEKSVLNVHHSLCPCGSCNGKYFNDLTRGNDKENIHDTSTLHNTGFHGDLKQAASDKMKQKICDASKSENWNFLQFRGSSQEIPFDKCSCSIQGQCVIQPNYYKDNKMASFASVKLPTKEAYKKPINFPMSNADMMYNYSCSESRRPNSSVCSSSSPYSVMTAAPTFSSSPSTSTSVRNIYSSETTYPVSSAVPTPGRDTFTIPLHLQMSTDASYNKSCCFSPPYPRGRTLYHNGSSDTEQTNQKQNSLVICGNSVNASPLKNVYFSHLESENINFDVHKCHQGGEHSSSLMADTANIAYATINPNSSDFGSPYSVATTDYTKSPQKMASSLNSTPKLPRRKRDDIEFIGEKKKAQRNPVKREKENVDCEFEKSSKCSVFDYCPEIVNPPSALNLSTLGTWHKTEVLAPGCTNIVEHKDSQSLPTSQSSEVISVPSKTSTSPEGISLLDVKQPKDDLLQQVRSVAVCSETANATSALNNILCSDILHAFDENSSDLHTIPNDKKQASGSICEKVDSKTFKDSVESMLLPEDLDVKNDVRIRSPVDTTNQGICSPSGKFQTFECGSSSILLDQVDSKYNQKEFAVNHHTREDMLEMPGAICGNDSSDTMKQNSSLNTTLTAVDESLHVISSDFSSEEHEVKSSKGKDSQNSLNPPCSESATPSVTSFDCEQDTNVISEDGMEKENPILGNTTSVSVKMAPNDYTDNCCTTKSDEKPVLAAGEILDSDVTEQETENDIKPEILNNSDIAPSKCIADNADTEQELEAKTCEPLQIGPEFDEMHGLNLLLDGIAQVEQDNSGTGSLVSDASNTSGESDSSSEDTIEKVLQASSIPVTAVDLDNLSLLCACAAHLARKCSNSAKSEAVQSHKTIDINCNYPSIKIEGGSSKSYAREHPLKSSTECEVTDGSEFDEMEMRKKLAELQKKYKAKQKELARLKSKKISSKKSMKKNGVDASKCSSGSPHSNGGLEPEGASCILKENSTALNSSFNSPGRLHSNFQKCDMKKFEDFVSNELSSMVVQCAKDVSCDAVSEAHNVSKSTLNNNPIKRTHSVPELKETTQIQDEEQTSDTNISKDKQQNNSPKKQSHIKISSNVVQNGQREKSKRNCSYSSVKVFPEQSMALRSRTKGKVLSNTAQKRKVGKTIETEISQSSNENLECSPKKLRSSESGKETTLSGDECSPAISPKSLSSKRKAGSPRKYSPLKQGNLTETIVTKQLRSRILIEELSELSEANDEQDDSDYVTEELFDALRKCHLSESFHRLNTPGEISKNSRNVFAEEKKCRLLPKHLVDKQRVLATEDGLFYAGHIKTIQPPDVYGIVLDGERGTKPHIFSREEILSDTILEIKPQSVLDLPLGTRVCAYWSQQYRCLYPGSVAKLTSKPKLVSSASWVYVEFDDGDSGQIPVKDVRLLPLDMLKESNRNPIEDNFSGHQNGNDLKRRVHNRKIKTQKKHSRSTRKELQASLVSDEQKVTSPQCDPSSDLNTSSSQLTDESLSVRLGGHSASSGKHAKRHSKSKGSSKGKLKDDSLLDEKNKKHKKYKEHHKHHRHHHRHRHHHHRHCHRHHHCKKRKHKKNVTVNIVTPSQDRVNASIPSSCIPDCSSASKTFQNLQQVEGCDECDVHSTAKELPQDSKHVVTGRKMASKKQLLKTRKSLHPFLTRSRKSMQRSGLPFCNR